MGLGRFEGGMGGMRKYKILGGCSFSDLEHEKLFELADYLVGVSTSEIVPNQLLGQVSQHPNLFSHHPHDLPQINIHNSRQKNPNNINPVDNKQLHHLPDNFWVF